MLKKLKKNKKKCFTLVELIVVLVILAILAALLIPALTGYIDKAKEKDVIAETRQVVMAAQTLTDEAYASKEVGATVEYGDDKDVTPAKVAELAEVNVGNINKIAITKSTVTEVQYTKSGKTCTYTYAKTDKKGTYSVK